MWKFWLRWELWLLWFWPKICLWSLSSISDKSFQNVFKVVKQKQDYIILEETSCEPYVSELGFQIDSSHQSMTYQSQKYEKKGKHSDPKR